MLKKLPYPVAGLMLGLASLGNLLLSYGTSYRYALGVLAAVILVALVAKAVIYPEELRTALSTPPVAAVLPTFSMGLSLLTAYIRPYAPSLALAIWWSALLMHVCLLVSFTLRHALPFAAKAVLPSWFIPYVGLGIFSITATGFGLRPLGQSLFWFALAAYFTLLPAVVYRLLVVKQIPAALLPTTAILVAPSSLTLVGYLASFPERNIGIVYLLLACTTLSMVGVLCAMPRLLRLHFAPSFSAFTFPFVIAAIAFKTANAFLHQSGLGIPLLAASIIVLEMWAVAMVCYVIFRYGVFLFSGAQPVQPPVPTR
jgi:exfoliative toxin A/B